MLNSFIRPLDKTLSGATTPRLSERGSDGNEGVMWNSSKLQHYWCLNIWLFIVIYRTIVGESYSSAEIQSVYSAAPAEWTTHIMSKEIL